jgi:5-methylcytosine-specific restriction endonuclease McrA
MKICQKCNINKIKNSYQQCYLCNLNDDTVSEPDNDKEITHAREPIPKCVRNALWINFFKDARVGMCQCCLRETISIGNFHAGHIKAHANGGSTTLDNLVPICMLCNTSIGKHDLNEFIIKYNLHYGIEKL